MKLERFFEKFELFADAPNAVAKMRELVLNLAVHGKLFGQVKSGQSDELPPGWRWQSLGELAQFINGDRSKNYPSKSFRVNDGVPFINAGHLWDGDVVLTDMDYITPEHFDRLGSGKVERGDVLYCLRGSLGKSAVVQSIGQGAIASSLLIIRPIPQVMSQFIYLYLIGPLGAQMISKYDNGSAQPNLSATNVKKYVVPLPPLAEQHRIVEKVDELMALCDRLDAQQQERDTRHAALARAALARFAEAPTPANLDFLFHPSYTITPADLRKCILTLAVQGKLVPQDPDDDPAEDSLTQNNDRRRETARSDHRADEENQPLLSGDDRWDIADTWSWRGLADLVLFVDYRGKTPAKLTKGVRLLTAKNVRKGQINLSPEEFLSESEYHSWMTRGFPKTGDVLFTTEAPMGNAAVVEMAERFALAQRVICFQSYGAIDPAFLVLQILSDQFQFILDKNGTGVTAKGIKASKLKQLPIAVPPLAEQRRIVAKVDQLMTLVDQLETQIANSRASAAKLIQAVVGELTTQ